MANPIPKKKKIYLDGKVRWNIRLTPELDVWAKAYAKRNGTTVTGLFLQYLSDLKRREEGDNVPQV